MSKIRRDSKGRALRNGESQRSDGKYMFRYADSIKTRDAEHTTVDNLFEQFMDIRKDLRESSRCCCNDIYRKHIKPVIGHRPVGRVKPTEIQKLYQIMVSESGVNPTTAQKAHSIIYQLFENAVMDNVIRMNPAYRAPLTVEQQEVFIDYIYASEKYGRMANLFTVLLGTGMRIGEALGLRWCDCNFEEGIIHVTHALLYKQGEDGNYRDICPKDRSGLPRNPDV